jgi:hypothetical protein
MIQVKKDTSALLFNKSGQTQVIDVASGSEFPFVKEAGDNFVICSFSGDDEFVVLATSVIKAALSKEQIDTLRKNISKGISERKQELEDNEEEGHDEEEDEEKVPQELLQRLVAEPPSQGKPAPSKQSPSSIARPPLEIPPTPKPSAPLPESKPSSEGVSADDLLSVDMKKIDELLEDVPDSFLSEPIRVSKMRGDTGKFDPHSMEKKILTMILDGDFSKELINQISEAKAKKQMGIPGQDNTEETKKRILNLVNELTAKMRDKAKQSPLNDTFQKDRFILAIYPFKAAKKQKGEKVEEGLTGRVIDLANKGTPIEMHHKYSAEGYRQIGRMLNMSDAEISKYILLEETLSNGDVEEVLDPQLYAKYATWIANERIKDELRAGNVWWNMPEAYINRKFSPAEAQKIQLEINEQKKRMQNDGEGAGQKAASNVPPA